jgi:hypothetical protein
VGWVSRRVGWLQGLLLFRDLHSSSCALLLFRSRGWTARNIHLGVLRPPMVLPSSCL